MDLIKMTRELGKAIQSQEAYLDYKLAQDKNDSDDELQGKIGAFNLTRQQLNQELTKENKDDEKVKELNNKLREQYGDVMANENMALFNEAKAKYDELTQEIIEVLNLCISGENPDTAHANCCGGGSNSCSSCSGCH